MTQPRPNRRGFFLRKIWPERLRLAAIGLAVMESCEKRTVPREAMRCNARMAFVAKVYVQPGICQGEHDEQSELADDGRLRGYGRNGLYDALGTVESKISRERSGRLDCRRCQRPTTTAASTGYTGA